MSNTDLVTLAAKFERLIEAAKDCGEQRSIFEINGQRSSSVPIVLQASDSFVVFSDVKGPADVAQFIWNIHHLVFHAMLMEELPIRGAIAYGEALVQTEPVMFVGAAVLEAFECEKRQAWAGACLAPSLEKYIEGEGLSKALFPLVIPYSVPAYGNCSARFAVNWMTDAFYFMDSEHVRSKFPECPVSDGEFQKVQEKIRNTVAFLEECRRIKLEHGPFKGPANRRVILEPGRPIRIVLDPDDGDNA